MKFHSLRSLRVREIVLNTQFSHWSLTHRLKFVQPSVKSRSRSVIADGNRH